MKAYLDNIPVTSQNESLVYPDITLRKKDETGERAFSFTGDLLFTGADYTYLYSKLVTDPNALTNKVVLKLENDCCTQKQTYEFYINHESLEWCDGDCSITAAAVEKSIGSDQYTCLKNTLIWDNYAGFTSQQHPRFSYCSELRPDWLTDVVIILAIATYTQILMWIPLLAVLIGLFNLVNGIIAWANSNFGTSWNQLTFAGSTTIDLNTLQSLNNQLAAFVVGCGRKHPSPLVRDYADNVCNKCGITFKSSIFKNPVSPYHNTCYVSAPVHKGVKEGDIVTYWVDENKPILNGTKFFNQLKGIVNGDYEIVGNTLTFERRDYFVPQTPWLDLTTYKPVIGGISTCWKWANRTAYSYASFEYFKDGVNWVGGEAKQRWDDIVEWNNPYSPLQKDEFKPLIEFSSCRFRDDGIDRDALTSWEWAPVIGPIIKNYKDAMLLNSHTCYQPMLLIWDGKSKANATVSGSAINIPGYPKAGANQFYNYPFWFDANYPGNLYDNFWAIEDPRTSGFQGFDFEAELIFDCALLSAIDLDGMVNTSKGMGKVNSIAISFKKNTMIIKGTV